MSLIYNISLLKEWEPMAKGSYNEYLLHKKKKQLIERIEHYQNITIFFISVSSSISGITSSDAKEV